MAKPTFNGLRWIRVCDLPKPIWPRGMLSSWIIWGTIPSTMPNREYDQETPMSSLQITLPPRLYLQFGLRDYMPNNWVLRPTDFPFKICEFDGENVEWSWLYNCARVEPWNEHKEGEWTRDPRQILYVADELYPNKPPEHGLKRFLYQTLGWHWDITSRQLKRGRHPL
jgi:hypothetical protein